MISSCNYYERGGIPVHDKHKKNKATKNKALTFAFDEVIPVDSSTFLMYPLTLSTSEKGQNELKRYTSGSGNIPCWNIAFYDIRTGKSNLLDSPRPIRINSFQKLKDIMVYLVTTTDYNGNGHLDDKDPTYMFTSSLAGKSFKQITPNNIDVSSFKATNSAQTILIRTVIDSNGDKRFGEDDDVVPMIFDSQKADVAEEAFNPSFKAEVNKVFNKLYKN